MGTVSRFKGCRAFSFNDEAPPTKRCNVRFVRGDLADLA